MQITLTSDITVRSIQGCGGDHMVVAAARVSVDGVKAAEQALNPEYENAGLINYLIKHRHGTPFEHGMLTVFVHAPIFVFREWHRHRVGFSYNEESARYKQLDPVFWIPRRERRLVPVDGFKSARPEFKVASDESYKAFIDRLSDAYTSAYGLYTFFLNLGYAKEAARAVLPVGIYSSCWVTCNPRSLMHFLSLRTGDNRAKFRSYPQQEIEEAALAVETIFAKGWPITYQAFNDNGRVAP